jgi:transposase-like protein
MLAQLSVAEQRCQAVMERLIAAVPVGRVAERYRISRMTVHAWIRRHHDDGPAGPDGQVASPAPSPGSPVFAGQLAI